MLLSWYSRSNALELRRLASNEVGGLGERMVPHLK